ncbi:MAG: hypothetical protein IPP15_08915 [Saprospiraceae bacterium]|uniref:Uncharacterized protein n=1 Tax=Candidatus Opimibacter skivensis TaxID=2982028 RepID=A0A9D7SSZ8_9BACT|nr:hypothetical protein [Candidatus Opimibacter skivensis]
MQAYFTEWSFDNGPGSECGQMDMVIGSIGRLTSDQYKYIDAQVHRPKLPARTIDSTLFKTNRHN